MQQIRFTQDSQWAPEGPQSQARLRVTEGQVLKVPEECPQHIAQRAVAKSKAEWVIPGPVEPSTPVPGPVPKAERPRVPEPKDTTDGRVPEKPKRKSRRRKKKGSADHDRQW